MAKITRKTAVLFGVNAGSTGVETFASKAQTGSLDPSTDPAELQAQPYWGLGWTAAQYEGIRAPWFQDRNAVDLVIFWQLAYALEMGIPEWDAGTIYYLNSVVSYGGKIFISASPNANQGNQPPANGSSAFWTYCAFPSTIPAQPPTCTVILSGNGTYYPPDGVVRLFVRLVGGGGGGSSNAGLSGESVGGSGGATTLGTLSAGGGAGGTAGGSQIGGSGGTATEGDLNITGQAGTMGGINTTQSYPTNAGAGGRAKTGGWAPAVRAAEGTPIAGASAAANSGGGGSGCYYESTESGPHGLVTFVGSGGGAGAYLEKTIFDPAASYTYAVGTGGTGASAETDVLLAGGNGGSGIIIIQEFYY